MRTALLRLDIAARKQQQQHVCTKQQQHKRLHTDTMWPRFTHLQAEHPRVSTGEIEAVLRGPETIELKADKSEAGCASLSYTCTKTGPYDLSITHGGRHIAGSPWKVSAFPGPAIASMCSVQGLPASVVAGAPFSFSLHTVDECGNPTVSTNTVTAELDSPADGVVPLLVSEGTDGTQPCCLCSLLSVSS